MIQRIQTIWLFLASAAMFATLKLPFYSGTHPGLLPPYSAVVQTLNATDNFGTLVLTSLLGTGIFITTRSIHLPQVLYPGLHCSTHFLSSHCSLLQEEFIKTKS